MLFTFVVGLCATVCSIVALALAWQTQMLTGIANIEYKVFNGLILVVGNEAATKSIQAFSVLACLFAGFGTIAALAYLKSPSGAKSGALVCFSMATVFSIISFSVYAGIVGVPGDQDDLNLTDSFGVDEIILYSYGFWFEVATAILTAISVVLAACYKVEEESQGDYGAPPSKDM